MYNGFAVLDARGLCPTGWHVPSDIDFIQLEGATGLSEVDWESTAGDRGCNLDLWNYRAQLPCSTKAQISPNKRVFGTSVSSVFRFKSLALLQKLILDQIDLMICHGLSESFRALGCIYVLTIFTEINNSIAQALPAIAQN